MQLTTTCFETSSPVVLAIDIGGTNLRMALVNSNGVLLHRISTPCRISEGIDSFLENISETAAALSTVAKTSGLAIESVGAGVPGVTDSSGRVMSSVNLAPLSGFNLLQWLENTLELPSTTLNDANAAAFAELTYGSGTPFSSFLHFTLGTGVGSGLVLDKKVWTGRRGIAAEYGHATVEPKGRLCNCGNQGCLEQYASATGITISARQYLSMGSNSILTTGSTEEITAARIARAAEEGDQVALHCLETAGRHLGIAAANAVNLLDLEAIIIGGGVAESFAILEPVITDELQKRVFPPARNGLQVLKGKLGDNAGLLGAAASAWELIS